MTLKFLQLNINGYKSKKQDLKVLISEEKPDIMSKRNKTSKKRNNIYPKIHINYKQQNKKKNRKILRWGNCNTATGRYSS